MHTALTTQGTTTLTAKQPCQASRWTPTLRFKEDFGTPNVTIQIIQNLPSRPCQICFKLRNDRSSAGSAGQGYKFFQDLSLPLSHDISVFHQ